MVLLVDWPRAEPITTRRLVLEPITVAHAPAMCQVLADPALYPVIGGEPPAPRAHPPRARRQRPGGRRRRAAPERRVA